MNAKKAKAIRKYVGFNPEAPRQYTREGASTKVNAKNSARQRYQAAKGLFV